NEWNFDAPDVAAGRRHEIHGKLDLLVIAPDAFEIDESFSYAAGIEHALRQGHSNHVGRGQLDSLPDGVALSKPDRVVEERIVPRPQTIVAPQMRSDRK